MYTYMYVCMYACMLWESPSFLLCFHFPLSPSPPPFSLSLSLFLPPPTLFLPSSLLPLPPSLSLVLRWSVYSPHYTQYNRNHLQITVSYSMMSFLLTMTSSSLSIIVLPEPSAPPLSLILSSKVCWHGVFFIMLQCVFLYYNIMYTCMCIAKLTAATNFSKHCCI